ncbi:MAG TPA: Xaa-Pro peptidase family protein [Solirubrobacterales bacterium]|nr:Xaa-Pro peptidase family protein [Solirubrobacterales bacterium]
MSRELWNPPPFGLDVHRARIDRAIGDCAERGLAGLLLFSQESLFYLFGYDQIGYWVFQAVYLPADGGSPVAICRAPDAFSIEQSPFIDDVRVWTDDQAESPAEMAIGLMGTGGGTKVGVELRSHSLLARYWSELSEAAAGKVELVDASDVIASRRAIKDEGEIEKFRLAARHLRRSYEAAEAMIEPGVRECDLLGASMDAMYRDGASPTAIHPPIASGPRTMSQTHGSATERAVMPGEPLVIEIGAAASRYHAVAARTYVIGEPSKPLADMHEAASVALESGFEAMAPGRSLADVARLAQGELSERGFSRAGRHVGYGTGIGFPPTWLEEGRIKVSDETPAQPGMTFFYFIGISDPEHETCAYVGEPVLITETGYERLLPYEAGKWRC